jgi:hypothetical protein
MQAMCGSERWASVKGTAAGGASAVALEFLDLPDTICDKYSNYLDIATERCRRKVNQRCRQVAILVSELDAEVIVPRLMAYWSAKLMEIPNLFVIWCLLFGISQVCG